ncbi:hypothetical protein IBX73_00210 [candidate division WOR-3 bacterium]|nr:hypothetical protein [candidate division WOR-3 bacterium]
MQKKIEDILDQLIADVNEGKNVGDRLRDHGAYADELLPLLELYKQIGGLSKPEPDVHRVMATVRKAQALSKEKRTAKLFAIRDIFVFSPMLVRMTATVVLVLLAAMTTVMLSANSLPGDALYPVKRVAERVQYSMTFDAAGKARLHVIFADRRTKELACFVEPGRPLDSGLLIDMLNQTRLAIAHIELLNTEDAALLIAQVARCNRTQLALLEHAKQHAGEPDRERFEEAIRACREQSECIECMQNPNSSDKTHRPCGAPQTRAY